MELGSFGTTLTTPDNVKTIVGNGKIIDGDIKNYSANPYRLLAGLFRQQQNHCRHAGRSWLCGCHPAGQGLSGLAG